MREAISVQSKDSFSGELITLLKAGKAGNLVIQGKYVVPKVNLRKHALQDRDAGLEQSATEKANKNVRSRCDVLLGPSYKGVTYIFRAIQASLIEAIDIFMSVITTSSIERSEDMQQVKERGEAELLFRASSDRPDLLRILSPILAICSTFSVLVCNFSRLNWSTRYR